MDGFQLIAETRSIPRWAAIPIYVISSRATDRYAEKAIALGATGCLTKPVRSDQLAALLPGAPVPS
jgi:CheY-like chemotaxis protein